MLTERRVLITGGDGFIGSHLCERLLARGVDFTCHLIGDGPRRKDIERQIERSGIKDVVVLHGARTRKEVARPPRADLREWRGAVHDTASESGLAHAAGL